MASVQSATRPIIRLKLKRKSQSHTSSKTADPSKTKWDNAVWQTLEDIKPDTLVLPDLLNSFRCPNLTSTTTPDLLKYLRLEPATPLSALPTSPTQWTPHMLLSISLHYRTKTMAAHMGFTEEKMKACLKHAAKWHGHVIGRCESDVRAMCWEYKRRHKRLYESKERTRWCGAGGILKERRETRTKTLVRLEKKKRGETGMSRKGGGKGQDDGRE